MQLAVDRTPRVVYRAAGATRSCTAKIRPEQLRRIEALAGKTTPKRWKPAYTSDCLDCYGSQFELGKKTITFDGEAKLPPDLQALRGVATSLIEVCQQAARSSTMRRWLYWALLPSLGCLSGVQASRPVEPGQPAPAPAPLYNDPAPAPQPQDDPNAQPQYEDDAPPPTPPPEDVVVEAPSEPDTAEAVYEDPGYDDPPVVAVRYAPPPMRYEPPPPMPEQDMAWVGGYWIWQSGEWLWMTGHWLAVRPSYYWVPPYYENRGDGVLFVPGHFLHDGIYFHPPPPSYRMVYVEARPGYRGYPPPRDQRGVFVPSPPGSLPGLIIPAPVGTPPQVVVSQPPVVRSGMVVHAAGPMGPHRGYGSVTISAPPGVTRSGAVVRSGVPSRPDYAAALPPRVMVAPPRPPPQVLVQHPNAVSPYMAHPVSPGQRYVLPPSARNAYQQQVQVHEQQQRQRQPRPLPQQQNQPRPGFAQPVQQQPQQRFPPQPPPQRPVVGQPPPNRQPSPATNRPTPPRPAPPVVKPKPPPPKKNPNEKER